jgi:tetratricopeptide (TPR) repeat protein
MKVLCPWLLLAALLSTLASSRAMPDVGSAPVAPRGSTATTTLVPDSAAALAADPGRPHVSLAAHPVFPAPDATVQPWADHEDSLFMAKSYLDQANEYYGSDPLDSALVYYERSLAWDPTNPLAWHGKGSTLGQMRRFREATAAYDEALRLRPNYFMAWWHRGCDNAAAGNLDDAISDLRHALALDSTKRSWPFEDSDWDSLRNDWRLLELTHGRH